MNQTDTDIARIQALAATFTPLADRHDEAERAADCASQAEALRESVAGAVEAAQTELAAIEAEAARTVNAARTKLRDVQAYAQGIEKQAAAASDKGRAYRAAANAARGAQDARHEAERLAAERRDHLGTADALSTRLADLDRLERAAQAELEAARQAADTDAAGQARTRLTGIQEVTPGLIAQRDTALGHARAIGTDDSGGTYAQALARVAAYTVEREQALDVAEPDRVEHRRAANPVGALLGDIAKMPEAAQKQIFESWGLGPQQAAKGPGRVTRGADGRITIAPGQ